MKVKILLLGCLLGCVGCVPFPKNLFTSNEVLLQEHRQKVEVFQDLLNQGWEMEVVNGKLLLIKHTESGILINDVFGVLDE